MNFLFTIDYELAGDGSGDVFELMINPTDTLLKICDEHNIKITIFFEVVEYWKLKQEWENGNTMGYQSNPIEAIEKQLQKAAIIGHDIQLHIHPQWVGATFENNKWEVDFSNWRLGGFKENEGYTIERLLFEGKKSIEMIIQQVVPEYRCIALRAGGYNIMPSSEVYSAMKSTGLRIDSSVFPGGYETSNLSDYDYRHVKPETDFWWVSPEDITQESTQHREILELPVFALKFPRWQKFFSLHRLKSMLFSNNSSTSSLTKSKVGQKSFLDKIKYGIEKEAFTWDFFLFSTWLHHQFMLYKVKKLPKQKKYFVLIGHPKSPFNKNGFISLIRKIEKKKGNFITIAQFDKTYFHSS